MNYQLKKYINRECEKGESAVRWCDKCCGRGYYCYWGNRYSCEKCKATGRLDT